MFTITWALEELFVYSLNFTTTLSVMSLLLPLFKYENKNWGTEWLTNMSKFAQLMSGKAAFEPSSLHPLSFLLSSVLYTDRLPDPFQQVCEVGIINATFQKGILRPRQAEWQTSFHIAHEWKVSDSKDYSILPQICSKKNNFTHLPIKISWQLDQCFFEAGWHLNSIFWLKW